MSDAEPAPDHKFNLFYLAMIAGVWLRLASIVHAQTFTVLHKFAGGPGDGAEPVGALIQSGNTLYGMTEQGGASAIGGYQGNGTVFSLSIGGGATALVHSFAGGSADGANPLGSLIESGNTLYGMTYGGGVGGNPSTGSGNGTIFSVNTTSNSETVLHFFAGAPTEGWNPYGSLIQSGQILYGMTADQSGSNSHTGTIFTLNTGNNALAVLHTFSLSSNPAGGAYPQNSLLQSGNILYGMTTQGGNNSGDGTIFAFDTTNNTETVLHTFAGGAADGAEPKGALVQSGNMLYGTTFEGGANNFGTIFSLNTVDDTEKVLYSFSSTDGIDGPPDDDLIQYGNVLYGTDSGGSSNDGAIYSFNTTTNSFAILHSFSGSDGRAPNDLMLSGNTLYGTTAIGGTNNNGVVFSLAVTLPVPEPTSASILAFGSVALLARRGRR